MSTLTWERVAFATGRGDGDLGAAVRQAYREAGLAEPERVIVLPSPAAGALAAARLTEADTGVSARDAVRTRPWEQARTAVYAELGASGWAAHWGQTGGRLWPRVDRLVSDIRRAIADLGTTDEEAPSGGGFREGTAVRFRQAASGEPLAGAPEGPGRASGERQGEAPDGPRQKAFDGLPGQASDGPGWAAFGGLSQGVEGGLDGEALRRVTLDAVLGQHDAPWLSAFDGLDGLKRVAECAGWWWPYERLAIVTERPVELHLDDLGRLHRADGPALRYADGFALYAWHGMPVPAGFGAALGEVTPERIRAEANAELRRVMLEHFGLERYLAESGAQPVHSDETGVLWRVELPGDESLVMVEVVNSTPEPDGTRRTYFLRVPPWVERARQGVAWTFGVGEEDYHPQRET